MCECDETAELLRDVMNALESIAVVRAGMAAARDLPAPPLPLMPAAWYERTERVLLRA